MQLAALVIGYLQVPGHLVQYVLGMKCRCSQGVLAGQSEVNDHWYPVGRLKETVCSSDLVRKMKAVEGAALVMMMSRRLQTLVDETVVAYYKVVWSVHVDLDPLICVAVEMADLPQQALHLVQ